MSGNQVSNVRQPDEQSYQTTTTTGSSSRIGTALANGNVGSTVNSPIEDQGHQASNNKRTQEDVDNKLRTTIQSTKITLDELKKIIESSGYTSDRLLSMDNSEFSVLEICIRNTVQFIMSSGKEYNPQKFKATFAAFKLCMVDAKPGERLNSEQAQVFVASLEEKDLFDILQGQVDKITNVKTPTKESKAIKDLIGNKKIKDLTPEELKNVLSALIISKLDKKEQNQKGMLNFYIALINNCNDDEKPKLFHAFALLLQDKNFQTTILKAFSETAQSFVDSNKLANFVNGDGANILKMLGFSEESINILQHQTYKGLDPQTFEKLLQDVLTAISDFQPEEIEIFFKALTIVESGGDPEKVLEGKEKEIYLKYSEKLNGQIKILAAGLDRKDLSEDGQNALNEINTAYQNLGLDEYIYKQLNNIYEQNPDLFENFDNKDDFTKKLNEITNNKFGEIIGDTNPDNLYHGSNNNEATDTGFGMSQRVSYNDITMLTNSVEQRQALLASTSDDDDDDFILIRNNHRSEEVTNPSQKFKSIANLTAKDLHEGLSKKYIKVGDILDKYENLTQSGKDFVEGLIAVMAPAQQNYFLNGIKNKNSVIISIIRHVKIDVNKLNLALDYANRKEVERIEKDRENAFK